MQEEEEEEEEQVEREEEEEEEEEREEEEEGGDGEEEEEEGEREEVGEGEEEEGEGVSNLFDLRLLVRSPHLEKWKTLARKRKNKIQSKRKVKISDIKNSKLFYRIRNSV